MIITSIPSSAKSSQLFDAPLQNMNYARMSSLHSSEEGFATDGIELFFQSRCMV